MKRALSRLLLRYSTNKIPIFCTFYHTENHRFTNFHLSLQNPRIYPQLSHFLKECSFSGDLRAGKSVQTILLKFNFNGFVSLWNVLLNLYRKHANLSIARKVFDEMPQRDAVSYNTMISANIRNCNVYGGVGLYYMMKNEGIRPNFITMASLIGAWFMGFLFHAHVIHYGLGWNKFVGSSLVDKYAKQRRFDDALRAFDEISELDLVSWNVMLDCCAVNGSKDHALKIFSQMQHENVGFDSFTLTSAIKMCSEPMDLYCGMVLHCVAVKAGFVSETPINNALITMYSKCEDAMVLAKRVFYGILEPNVISWTAIVAGLMQNGMNDEAIGVYREMLEAGVRENDFSFASILPVLGNVANLDQGRQIHARVVKTPFSSDLSVNNTLIDMYSNCGSLVDANSVFLMMENHDLVSYTTMITCFAQHGKGRDALSVLNAMIEKGLIPDDVTFLGCLSACSHSGLVDVGVRVFDMMIKVYNRKPKREHFSCIVDMLGRAGKLTEAERFIGDAGVESDVFVWETLLGACSVHGEREFGEKIAKRIVQLTSNKHEPFVLLANMYAASELWEDKEVLREGLAVNGRKTEMGRSWVT